MMIKCLLSIDWDYFIYTRNRNFGSYIENRRTIIDLWYKRYIVSRKRGEDITKAFSLSKDVDRFWEKIKKAFIFEKNIKVYVSDSHTLSYDIAADHGCNVVYLFDAHSDLGYGGLQSLDFEINCANWLGKLLKDGKIEKAYIIYSPFTLENPSYFDYMNRLYDISYPKLEELDRGINIPVIHICRSGAWSPPWYDEEFFKFINGLGLPYRMADCPVRKWDTSNINLSNEIFYLMT